MKKSEILAPVGNKEMLTAAIAAGADAVYIGGNQFSARAYAENFTDEEMEEAISLCHFNDMKVYVTVNTIIKENEMEDAVNYIRFLYEKDVDAVILQDLGLAKNVKEIMPDLDLHASTQLNTRNIYGAAFLKDAGFSRIVLAREISLEEMKRIKENVDIELEIFIHGSLCVSESGSCYMSSFIGGRSGNRGRCAQPCRKEYQLYNKNKKKIGEENSYLSLKDLNTVGNIQETVKMGIDSLKIEGRMKKPEYVYSTIMNYRAKMEGFRYEFSLEEFRNRDFTTGYQWGIDNSSLKEIDRNDLHKGKRIGKIVKKKKTQILLEEDINKGDILLFQTVRGKHLQMEVKEELKKSEYLDLSHIKDAKSGSPVHRISNQAFKSTFMEKELKKKKAALYFTGKKGHKAQLRAECENFGISVESENRIQEAQKAPLSAEKIRKQLSKTGGTYFDAEKIEIEIEDDIFFSLGEINALRREALEALYRKITVKNNRKKIEPVKLTVEDHFPVSNKSLSVETEDTNIGKGKVSIYYTDSISSDTSIVFRVPRIDSTNEEYVRAYIQKNIGKISGFLIGSLNELYFVKDFEKRIYCDWTFNIVNSYTLELLKDYGCCQAALSLELNFEEINAIKDVEGVQKEIIIYSPLQVMTTRYCPFSILKKCDMLADCENCSFNNAYMKDSKDQWIHVRRELGFSRLYNEEKMETAAFFKEIVKGRYDILRINLLEEENPEAVFNYYYSLFKSNKEGENYNKEYSKAHYLRGVE